MQLSSFITMHSKQQVPEGNPDTATEILSKNPQTKVAVPNAQLPQIEEKKMEGEVSNLFINYLPVRAGDDTLRALFSPYGKIESCKVMIDLQTGQSRCFGFVQYSNAKSVQSAISVLHGHKIDNKCLVVKVANSLAGCIPKGTPSNNIYIKGIPDTISEEELRTLFSPYGTTMETKILVDPETSKSKGIGFVRYRNSEGAVKAIKAMNGTPIYGSLKPLVVRYADSTNERKARQKQRIVAPRYAPYPLAPLYQYYQPYMHPSYLVPQIPVMGSLPIIYDPNQLKRKLFVYHLPQSADDALLYRLFSPFGAIESVNVVKNTNGECKGFGFVKMIHHADALRAIRVMHGTQSAKKTLKVSFKK